MSNRYTFTDETVISYLEKHEQYSEYVKVLQQVPVSRVSETTMYQLLTARGHYTCFAPTNEALQDYLNDMVEYGLISEASWDAFPNERMRDSVLNVVAKNSIIDSGENDWYETGTFPSTDNGEFPLANMNDRKLTVHYGSDPDSLFINSICPLHLTNRDIVGINGVIHCVTRVIAPSDICLGQLLTNIVTKRQKGFLVMSRVVEACHLNDTLNAYRDEVYEERYLRGLIPDMDAGALGWTFHGATGHKTAYAPEHRKFGFTLFAEPDSFWEEQLGKDATLITPKDVLKWISDNHQYASEDQFVLEPPYDSPQNLLYQWATYHLLPMKIAANRLVFHVNEKGYSKHEQKPTIPVYEYYTTMGQRRLLKIYESAESKGIYLNRFPVLRNGRHENGHERSCEGDRVGCRIGSDAADLLDYETVNGIIYALDAPLSYDDVTRGYLSRERIRFDGMSLFPEAMNNDIRKKASSDYHDQYVHIPSNSVYQYFENMDLNDNTHFVYLNSYGYDWCNNQSDEMKACGQYEITVKLPPVPRANTYELRYRVLPQPERGVIQFYFGDDKRRLVPTDIPVDLRIYGNTSVTGWEDDTDDDDYNAEVDKKMRNNHRMKGEESITNGSGSARSGGNAHIYRYILLRQQLDPNKTYYLRMKSVLDSQVTEFYMDCLEWVPKEVYDNPQEPEDIW